MKHHNFFRKFNFWFDNLENTDMWYGNDNSAKLLYDAIIKFVEMSDCPMVHKDSCMYCGNDLPSIGHSPDCEWIQAKKALLGKSQP